MRTTRSTSHSSPFTTPLYQGSIQTPTGWRPGPVAPRSSGSGGQLETPRRRGRLPLIRRHRAVSPTSVSARAGPGRLALFHFDELALNVDVDLVANDESAVQHHVELHSEVLSVDLALGRVADPMTHV